MPIWELTPVDETSDHWRASTYKGHVIVRAKDEDEARELANLNFVIATKRVPGGNTLYSPWKQSTIVSCRSVENSNYEEKGATGVLYPEV
jgi:hypothetical protein